RLLAQLRGAVLHHTLQAGVQALKPQHEEAGDRGYHDRAEQHRQQQPLFERALPQGRRLLLIAAGERLDLALPAVALVLIRQLEYLAAPARRDAAVCDCVGGDRQLVGAAEISRIRGERAQPPRAATDVTREPDLPGEGV